MLKQYFSLNENEFLIKKRACITSGIVKIRAERMKGT